MDPKIEHDPAAKRFSVTIGGLEAELDYRIDAQALVIVHTGVPPALGGRGIAGRLVQSALQFAEAEHLRVVPECSYASDYFDRHPEYQHLVRPS